MKEMLILLKPHRVVFAFAILALVGSSFFNATMTALVEPLMDNVFDIAPESADKPDSRTEKIFGFQEKLDNLNNWLKDHGIDFEAIQSDAKQRMTPVSWAILVLFVFLGQAL